MTSESARAVIMSWLSSSFDPNNPLPESLASIAQSEAVGHMCWGIFWLIMALILFFVYLACTRSFNSLCVLSAALAPKLEEAKDTYMLKKELTEFKESYGDPGFTAFCCCVTLLLMLVFSIAAAWQLSAAAQIHFSPVAYLLKTYAK